MALNNENDINPLKFEEWLWKDPLTFEEWLS